MGLSDSAIKSELMKLGMSDRRAQIEMASAKQHEHTIRTEHKTFVYRGAGEWEVQSVGWKRPVIE